jgi:beta-mannanase
MRAQGRGLPILFRPYHEMNGGWFWWGDQKDGKFNGFYKALWKKTHEYFTVEHGLKNLIWVYSRDGQTRPENALLGWPLSCRRQGTELGSPGRHRWAPLYPV